MNDQELQNLWKNNRVSLQINDNRLINDLTQHINAFDKGISARNFRETLAGIIVIIFFAVLTFFIPGAVAKIGAVVCSLYGAMVIYILHTIARKKNTDVSVSLKEHLLQYRNYLMHEKKLLNTILYWYLLPPTIGSLLIIIGSNVSGIRLLVMISVILLINSLIFYFNRKSIQKTINPLLSTLTQNIEHIEKH